MLITVADDRVLRVVISHIRFISPKEDLERTEDAEKIEGRVWAWIKNVKIDEEGALNRVNKMNEFLLMSG